MKQSISNLIGKATASLDVLELLSRIMPPQAIIHIGAGAGIGDMHLWKRWAVPHALIIDANPARLDWVESLAAENPAWQVRAVVLSDGNNEVDYYRASNPDQDGLISPEKLAVLWPNLHTRESMRRQTHRLDSLLGDLALASFRQDLSTWLLIDCLPALTILEGAGSDLDRWSVLWLRVLLKPLADDDTVGTLNELEIYLRPRGYRCIHVFEENHPAVGKALFIRDWHGQLMPIIKKLNEENSAIITEKVIFEQQALIVNNDLQNKISVLAEVHDEQSQLVAERQAQVVALTKEKTALLEELKVLGEEIITLRKTRDEQARIATEVHNEFEHLQSKLQLREIHVVKLESELAERDVRQRMLNEEMIKAEAQIDLIKDVLMR
jgi:hypothetical protein